ncbi:MAG: T9SS type A sorting domain-containing protein [Saprospiraceae bacterium]|nr:T9SS type A sorting domain-containing protein [Saprospiraceae bacterium]
MRMLLFEFFQYLSFAWRHQMPARLLTFCYLLPLGFTLPATAQITIENAVFPVVGDTLHYAFGNQPGAINQIFTPPGGGQQWDLSNLQPTQAWDQIIRNPQTGSAAASFPAASVLFNPLNSANQVYWQVTGNQVNDLGYYGLDELGLGLNLLFIKSPSLEQSWAPVNFFDIHQSASNVLTAFDAPIAPPVLINLVPTADSFRIRVAYQRIGAIDAYGTLAIPGGTFEVLRKKQTEYKSTAVDVKVAPLGWIDISTIGGQLILPLGTDTITTFHFLNDVSKEAIAICTLNTAQNAVTNVQYKVVSPLTGTDHVVPEKEQLSLYPNPARQTVTLQWKLPEAADVRIVVSDVTGRQLYTLLDERVSAGPQLTRYSLPQMQSGLYFVQVLTNGALQHTDKLFIL